VNSRQQRGAATLVVVMVLFFIISMVAAYTSRNMIFEQRTGANLYRATQSFEAAEAGMNWAVMMLNSGRIDDQCRPSVVITDNSFRDRYLAIDPGTGLITPTAALAPTCVFDGGAGTWTCSCVAAGTPPTAPAGTAVSPAFRIRFSAPVVAPPASVEPGVVRVDVVGCTRLDAACLDVTGVSLSNEGRTVLGGVFMLSGRATAYPQAALTARGNVLAAPGTGGLSVINAVSAGSGVAVHTSGTVGTGLVAITGAGGAPGAAELSGDTGLLLPAIAASGAASGITAAERFFAAMFMLTPQRWNQMPGVLPVNCGIGCNAVDVRAAIANNPGRPLWLNGNLLVNSAGDIGDAATPVMMVVNGDVVFTTAGVTVHGLLMIRPVAPAVSWNIGASTASGTIRGAVVVDGAVTGTGPVPSLVVQYDDGVLGRLRTTSGTFFRVPGSWRDWVMP
jgi:Tfp pilus assembly protein PilX